MSILDRINSPADLKPMTRDELRAVAEEMRTRLIEVCSRTGGHIGAGLGVVELTVALHAIFDSPTDKIVWDVGHQGYPHKLLTGRGERIETLRQEQGLSGFLKRSESEYDAFGAGHAGTAISAGYGMAVARDLNGQHFKVVSILGDGALTCGLAYEGLNNAGASERDFIVVLNDNEMSIAPNVGAMSKYLTSIQRNPLYNRVRSAIGSVVDAAPGPLSGVGTLVRKWEESMKSFLTPGVLFEELGFRYFGPIDGHDIDALMDTFAAVKELSGPRLVHCITQKGKGFPAGEHVEKWHALPPGHDPATGKLRKVSSSNSAYTAVFGQALVELGKENPKVVAITGAMPSGTGTSAFAKTYPDRFFDVGIAEGHAVTFAAGLATEGIRPVCAIYSTFLQRAYDNVIHDVAIQQLPVIFAMDRAGVVGEDGPTHMGLYDIAYMLAVPGMVVTAPMNGSEMVALLRSGLEYANGPFCLRYPRDATPDVVPATSAIAAVPHASWEILRRATNAQRDPAQAIAILAVGTMVLSSLAAAEILAEAGVSVTVVNCRYLKPHDRRVLAEVVRDHHNILVVEEGTVVNGFGSHMAAVIAEIDASVKVIAHGVPDDFVDQASRAKQLARLGLDPRGIANRVTAAFGVESLRGTHLRAV
ncbi:MAG TPA: 1-deoxy-D-xylulose-5-phosphate synthase [Gemmatimonadaceae bacterium]|nr:1-deoxy-D-xylulose-5-phosphate synthase [Gemmatimonadaceae bacterium]